MSSSRHSGVTVDPVAAYDRIAADYRRISDVRRFYLDQVEHLIISAFPPGARSLLDVGAGDGRRAQNIAIHCGIRRLVLLEPSAAMRQTACSTAEVWDMRADELGQVQDEFDVITCLWNVLGHLDSASARAEVMRQFARLLRGGGVAFLDVNHRYNASEYGVAPTLQRWLQDRLQPDERNGDVRVQWHSNGGVCVTKGHVFTDREVRNLIQAAGLKVQQRFVIDYATGQVRQRAYQGNLLYVAIKKTIA